MTISLSEADRARIRYHLGYHNTEPTAAIALGVPSATQSLFLVERGMDRLLPEAIPLVLRFLEELDSCEQQMSEARRRLKAQQLGELKLRNSNEETTERGLLEEDYCMWACKLADSLGAPVNVYSYKFRHLANNNGLSIPVRNA